MTEASKQDSPEVLDHLLVLMQLRDKSKRIQRKIEEVTERLQHAQREAGSATDAPNVQYPLKDGDGHTQSILNALKELDDLLGQPDLITRDELRSHLQDLIRQLGESGSD